MKVDQEKSEELSKKFTFNALWTFCDKTRTNNVCSPQSAEAPMTEINKWKLNISPKRILVNWWFWLNYLVEHGWKIVVKNLDNLRTIPALMKISSLPSTIKCPSITGRGINVRSLSPHSIKEVNPSLSRSPWRNYSCRQLKKARARSCSEASSLQQPLKTRRKQQGQFREKDGTFGFYFTECIFPEGAG